MFSTETFAAPDTMFWGGAKGGKRKTVRKPAGQSEQKKADKKSRAVSKQLERKRRDDGPDSDDEQFPKFYRPGQSEQDKKSRPTLAEVASDADASAVHHFDATQGDADSSAGDADSDSDPLGGYTENEFWANVEEDTPGLYDSDDEFWANASPNPPDEIEDAKKDAITDQAEQDAPTSHIVQPAETVVPPAETVVPPAETVVPPAKTVSEQQFTEARESLAKRLRESVAQEPDVTPQPTPDRNDLPDLPESDEELDQPSNEQATIPLDDAMPVEESDAPVTAPPASKKVPETVQREANLTMDVDDDELRAREEAKADEIKRSRPVDIDIDVEGDRQYREENKGSIPVDLDIDVEGDREAAKIRKQEEKLRKKAEALAKKERLHRQSWSRRNFSYQEEYDLADIAEPMEIDEDTGKVKDEFVGVVTERLMATYKSQYADLRKSMRLLKKTRAKQQDKPKELPGWHFLEGQTRIWTNPYAISAIAAYPRGEGFQSRYGPKKVFGIEQ